MQGGGAIRGLSYRTLALAVGAVAAGLSAGRSMLSEHIETRKRSEVEKATEIVRQRIRAETDTYIAKNLKSFFRRTAIKATILGGTAVTLLGFHSKPGLGTLVTASVLAVFLIWDAISLFPTLRLVLSRLSRAGYNPRRALGEVVATNVFAQVLQESEGTTVSQRQALLLALAGTNETRMKTEIAHAVSEVAAETSWHDLRPFLLLALAKVGAVFLLYAVYVAIILHLV